MSDVVQKLWGFCHTLRHDGIDYGDYIEQLTYLLFLKMADERGIDLSKTSVTTEKGENGCDINPPKPSSDALPPDAPVTFVPMPGVDAEHGTITKPETRDFGKVRKGYTSFREDDVIMAKITPCMENGKAAIARGLQNGLGFGSTEFHVFRSNGAILSDFLYHLIRRESFRKAAEQEMTGSVGQKRVPASFPDSVEVPLSPLAEQERIVAKIEELLGRVTATRERLATVPTILKRFRQAVLASACSGRLTEDYRNHLTANDSSQDLLLDISSKRRLLLQKKVSDSYKEPLQPDPIFAPEKPDQWVFASMDQLTCLVTSGSRGWAKYYSNSGSLFIRAQDINTDRLILDDVAHVKLPRPAEGQRTRVCRNDLLVTITGANVTRSAIVNSDLGEAYVSQHVALVRPVDPSITEYLYLWLLSPIHGRAKLLNDAYGAGKPGLNLDDIKEIVVSLPSFSEQEEIVRRVEALFKLADTIEKRVAAGTRMGERLTHAILTKAFRGELVPTEAELARTEGRSYETALELLSRIAQHPKPVAHRQNRAQRTAEV
jgi:type I restriction enzyme, S subunit